MKKKIILKRVFHRGRRRMLISFDHDVNLSTIVRQLKGHSYSDTYKSWYADDDEATLKQIMLLFRENADIDISALTGHPAISDSKAPGGNKQSSFPGSGPVEADDDTKAYESEDEMIPARRTIERTVERKRYAPVEFRINEQDGRLAVKFTGRYDGEWMEEIRSYGNCFYDRKSREFLLPWSILTGDSLSDYFASKGVEVNPTVAGSRSDGGWHGERDAGGDTARRSDLAAAG
jgi:hypothetical protein